MRGTCSLSCHPQHPSDSAEFVAAIHAAQNIVACRVAQRADPETFPIHTSTSSDALKDAHFLIAALLQKLGGEARLSMREMVMSDVGQYELVQLNDAATGDLITRLDPRPSPPPQRTA
jgi:hypothetical protein